MIAIIHLNWDAKQARLFRSARTGKQASGILSRRYASGSAPNVMRLEECFGTARQVASQSMADWIAYMENLSEELIAVGVDVTGERLANSILGVWLPTTTLLNKPSVLVIVDLPPLICFQNCYFYPGGRSLFA